MQNQALEKERDENQEDQSAASKGELLQHLTFTVGEEEFGVDIMDVREIKGWTEVTRLPNSPHYMMGVMNLRGIIVPIFDLRCRFGMGNTETDPKKVVIIITIQDRTIGILVDTVSDILEVNSNDIKQAPSMESGIDDKYVEGIISVEKRMVVVLDVDKLFDVDELKELVDKAR